MSTAKALKGVATPIIVRFPSYEDEEIFVAVRLLNAIEDLTAFKGARARAKAAGVESPTEADPEYVIALHAHVVAVCVEETINAGTKEAPEWKGTGRPFFESVDEVMSRLDQDQLFLLYQIYQTFRTTCGKQISEITPENITEYISEMGSERGDQEILPFLSQFKPGTQYRLARITAAVARRALESSSGGGSASTPEPGETTQVGCEPPGSSPRPPGVRKTTKRTRKNKRN